MISNGTRYMKAINDRIALNMAVDEAKQALVSLGQVPETYDVRMARAHVRLALEHTERENARIEAECRAWEKSPAAAREEINQIDLCMINNGRDMEKVA